MNCFQKSNNKKIHKLIDTQCDAVYVPKKDTKVACHTITPENGCRLCFPNLK